MAGAPVTQEQFTEFKEHFDSKFDELKQDLRPILDPESGIFIKVSKNDDAIQKAHERIDDIYQRSTGNLDILRGNNGTPGLIDDIRDLKKFKQTLVRVFWILLTPILGSIGLAIYAISTTPK